jgi:hypothetical protein
MITPRSLFTAIFLFSVSLLYSQAAFQAAFVIDLNGDTIRGLIENNGEVKNSQISSYRFEDGNYYVSKLIEIGDEPEMVFAECLVKGAASLYYLRNDGGDFYFIEKQESGMEALTNEEKEVIINGTRIYAPSNRYIRVLKALFSDCPEIQSSIDHAKFNHRSLSSITSQYNDYISEGGEYIIYEHGSRIKFRAGPAIGFSVNQLSMIGDELFEAFDFNNSNDPVIGAVMEVSSTRLGNHLHFQLGTEFNKCDFSATYQVSSAIYPSVYYNYDVHLQALSMKIYVGPKYNFTSGRIRPNLGGGLLIHKFIQPDFWYVMETHDGDVVTTDEWRDDVAGNWFYGVYLQAGVDVSLSQRLILFGNIKAGYNRCDPKTIAGLNNGVPDQLRISTVLIPLSFSVGILF